MITVDDPLNGLIDAGQLPKQPLSVHDETRLIESEANIYRLKLVGFARLACFENEVPQMHAMKLSDVEKLVKLGDGSYGLTYKARSKISGTFVALKMIESNTENGVPPPVIREICILQRLRGHCNVVNFLQVIMEDTLIGLVLEYLPMNLKKYIDSLGPNGVMSSTLVQKYLFQMVHTTCFCHSKGILHRNLRTENLLLDGNGKVKFTNFTLARDVEIPMQTFAGQVETPCYYSPEVLLGVRRYSESLDIWSIGCIFAEMATGKPLFTGTSEIYQLFSIFRMLGAPTESDWNELTSTPHYGAWFPQWYGQSNSMKAGLADYLKDLLSEDGIDLLQCMIKYDPGLRISPKKMLSHLYLKGVHG
uniref:Protein kinase domain-containing protein n=1 Tax=Trichuris muris TaxID=70415 RepID=A0A5S6Q1R3_TRIMR